MKKDPNREGNDQNDPPFKSHYVTLPNGKNAWLGDLSPRQLGGFRENEMRKSWRDRYGLRKDEIGVYSQIMGGIRENIANASRYMEYNEIEKEFNKKGSRGIVFNQRFNKLNPISGQSTRFDSNPDPRKLDYLTPGFKLDDFTLDGIRRNLQVPEKRVGSEIDVMRNSRVASFGQNKNSNNASQGLFASDPHESPITHGSSSTIVANRDAGRHATIGQKSKDLQAALSHEDGAEVKFREVYRESPHSYLRKTDPGYNEKYRSQEIGYTGPSIKYSPDNPMVGVTPNQQWMYPHQRGATQKSSVNFSEGVIESVLGIPGLNAMTKVPTLFNMAKNLAGAGKAVKNVSSISQGAKRFLDTSVISKQLGKGKRSLAQRNAILNADDVTKLPPPSTPPPRNPRRSQAFVPQNEFNPQDAGVYQTDLPAGINPRLLDDLPNTINRPNYTINQDNLINPDILNNIDNILMPAPSVPGRTYKQFSDEVAESFRRQVDAQPFVHAGSSSRNIPSRAVARGPRINEIVERESRLVSSRPGTINRVVGNPLAENKSGHTRESIKQNASKVNLSQSELNRLDRIPDDVFKQTVTVPGTGLKIRNTLKTPEYTHGGSSEKWTRSFNQHIDKHSDTKKLSLNQIIAKNNKSSQQDIRIVGYNLDESSLLFASSGEMPTGWTVYINPGTMKQGRITGQATDVSQITLMPGMSTSNTGAGVPRANKHNIPEKTGIYKSLHEYLRQEGLGVLKDGAGGKTSYSAGAWNSFIRKDTGTGFYSKGSWENVRAMGRVVTGAAATTGGKSLYDRLKEFNDPIR